MKELEGGEIFICELVVKGYHEGEEGGEGGKRGEGERKAEIKKR